MILLISGWFSALVQAEESLVSEIKAMDKALFDAFNRCDIDAMAKIFSPDLEFYHDTGGLQDYQQTMAATRANCERNLGLTRTLIADSMEVFPIKDYGAIQQARHQFCHWENGKHDCGTFRFVHIWQKQNNRWQLTRVVSYDH